MLSHAAHLLPLSLSLLLGAGSGFNLAPRNSTVVSDPFNQSRSFFGYNVQLQRRDKEGQAASYWLIVAAPKANVTTNSLVEEPGTVYQCDLADMSCTPFLLDGPADTNVTVLMIKSTRYKILTRHAWAGGAIALKHQPGGGIVVCAPRAKLIYSATSYMINGIIYLKDQPHESKGKTTKYFPLSNLSNQLIKRNNTKTNKVEQFFFYAHGEAGLSAQYTKDDTELLVGVPGLKSWTGSVARYKNFGLSNQTLNIANPSSVSQLEEYSFFGYAVSSGKFLSSSESVSYVAGAPRAGHMTGKVFIYEYQENSDNLNILVELEGTQMGEYFGASVCVVDLNGDGLDDLVVGAPHHSLASQSAGDEGRVYVFINEDMRIFLEIGDKTKIMGSQKENAQFGTTVAHIGDLNLDGYNDVAVGAPYEESGRGAIYIYHGRSSGIHLKYSQRITAAEIHTYLSGFGISISRGMDVDNNYYNEVAVGAFHSGHAVLIPSQPVISVRTRLSSDVKNIGLNASRFWAIACLSYTGQRAPPTTGLLITLQFSPTTEGAVFLPKTVARSEKSTYQYYRLLNNNKEHCDHVRVGLIENITRDYTKPVDLMLHYELDYRHQVFASATKEVGFCKTCPVVDPSHKTTTTLNIPYAIDCGDDDVCKIDLNVQVNFVHGRSEFVLGSQPKLSLKVLVSNRAEQAFFVKVNASLPRETPLSRLPSVCEEISDPTGVGPTQLECDMGSLLASGAQREFLLELDTSGLGPKVSSLEYTFNVTGVGEEQHPDDNIRSVSLPVRTITDVSIQGQLSQDRGNFSKHNQTFYHTYEVRNYGPSPADILKLEFHIPVIAKGLSGDKKFLKVFKPSAYFDKQPISCIAIAGQSFDVAEENDDDIEEKNDDETEEHFLVRRSVEVSQIANIRLEPDSHSDIEKLPSNRTLLVNCSGSEVECLTVVCDAGPFKTSQNRAVVSFRLVADFGKIEPIIGKKDIVVISSHGKVKILNLPDASQPLDGRPDEASVNSVFFGSRKEESIDSWLLAISIAAGILILFLIVGALTKMGFFVRSKRNELNDLKEECEGRLVPDMDNESDDGLQNVNL